MADDLGNGLPTRGAGMDFRSDNFTSRDSRYVKAFRKEDRLRPFATSGRAEEEQYHDNSRLHALFSRVNGLYHASGLQHQRPVPPLYAIAAHPSHPDRESEKVPERHQPKSQHHFSVL